MYPRAPSFMPGKCRTGHDLFTYLPMTQRGKSFLPDTFEALANLARFKLSRTSEVSEVSAVSEVIETLNREGLQGPRKCLAENICPVASLAGG